MSGRAWARARVLGGVLVLAVLVWRLGADPFLDGIRGLGPGALLAAAAIGAGTTVCSAWRWRAVAAALGVGLPMRAAVAAYYRGQLLNSLLPGGVVGDVYRGVRHGADVGDLGRALRAVVWERVAGQVVQVAMALAVLTTFPSPLRGPALAVAGVGAVAAGVLLATGRGLALRGPVRLARLARAVRVEARTALLQPSTWPPVLVASVLAVLGYLGTFLLAAHAAGVHGPPPQLLPLALVVLLAAAIPVNVGGWGPREGVAAWVFATAGWGAAAGASVATAFGVLVLVSVLPGVLVLVADRRHPPRPRTAPTTVRRPGDDHVQDEAREDGALHG
ncbi:MULTISPECIES: lysylphosphatidylglycerol synthase transmembrane domain-containing protein [unclassified Blastococcus]|uniref:lysylphosphatidylglycerol synthase transmembrane domain-containing protein n=1 Tax=unclassified Blastococcus TaxID=2619396 RepID=UPI001EF05A58|nr:MULTISPECIES: lysylphosphatidylglycerol synthase transmembrane domain-containing protein [unclassified Blastococcus]